MYANTTCFQKVLSIFPIIPVYFIIYIVSHAFTKFYYYDKNEFDIIKSVICILFYFSATMVITNHLLSMLIKPGFVSQDWQPVPQVSTSNKSPYGENLFCKLCNNKRPERAHHCKTCKKCVLKMDHHCPWVANCIGFNNQKYFYLFLFYAVLGNLIAFLVLLLKIINADFTIKSTDKKTIVNSFSELLAIMWSPILLMTSTIMSISMVIAIGVLFIVQTRSILNNITTVESHIFTTDNPWGYNDKFHNFKIVMGEYFFLWPLPIFFANIYNNGYSFTIPGKEIQTSVTESVSPPKYVQLANVDANDSTKVLNI